MRVSTAITAASFLVLGITSAQSIDYSELPSCAQQCELLTQANAACVSAPVYLSCFCQSAYLVGLSSSAASICGTVCTSSTDQQSIVNWFNGQCSATATASLTTAAATGAATPTPSSADSSATSGSTGPTWWSQHYQWIIMVIVLIIGFGIIIAVGVVLKKRHNRKRNAAGNLGPMPAWDASENQYGMHGAGQEKETGQVSGTERASGGRGKGSSRVKKVLGR